tara:strand:+ start:2613 stop:3593 length:981 start_codon:yes stop_codon:yes gene_type:complete
MASLSMMATCSECDSTDIEYSGEWPSSCNSCGFQWNFVPDNLPPIYTEKDWITSHDEGKKSNRINYLLQRQRKNDNRKSPAHHEGLNYIKEYPETLPGLLDLSKLFFNKGVKAQSNKLRQSNETSKMFMPSGKANSSLFASFSCILYAHRYLTGEWNSHLNNYSDYIKSNFKPMKNGNLMKKSHIKTDLSYSYSKIRVLVSPPRKVPVKRSKSAEFSKEINNVQTLFIDNNHNIPKDCVNMIEEIVYRINSSSYQQKLEQTIPNSSLDLLAAETLWQVLSLSESKISRASLSRIIFNSERRISDKKSMVKEIISIIEIDINKENSD